MNSDERSLTPLTVTVPVRSRRRLMAAIIAGVLVFGATGAAALWYFRLCGSCSGPILCTDPCTLPTFS